jgi:uncharacterized protein (TIGR00369 family)
VSGRGRLIDVPHALTLESLNQFLADAFDGGRPYEVIELGEGTAKVLLPAENVTIRPGGTVSGPTLMMVADAAAYAVVLAHIGPVALAVTSSLTINFLRKPEPDGVIADATLLKLGRKLAVAEVKLRSEGHPELIASASVTYAIPSSASPPGG